MWQLEKWSLLSFQWCQENVMVHLPFAEKVLLHFESFRGVGCLEGKRL